MTTIKERVQAILPKLIEIRHDIHAHPELGYQETRTASVIRSFLEEREIDFAGNLAGGTGTLAHIAGDSNKAVGLRADIAALPITEENTFDCL